MPLEDHAAHLIVHGTLHLLGYDHEDEGSAEEMERREVRALARLGIATRCPFKSPRCRAGFSARVITTETPLPCCTSELTSAAVLYAAMPPVMPRTTFLRAVSVT